MDSANPWVEYPGSIGAVCGKNARWIQRFGGSNLHRQQHPSRTDYRAAATPVLRTSPTATRKSYRRSLRWKDAKSSFLQIVEIPSSSNGWISMDDSCVESLSKPVETPRDLGKTINKVNSDINSTIAPVKVCETQSRSAAKNWRLFQRLDLRRRPEDCDGFRI